MARGALFCSIRLDDQMPADPCSGASMTCSTWITYGDCWRPATARPDATRVDPELMLRMLLVGCCFGSASNAIYARRCISIPPSAGSAGSIWRTECPIIQARFRPCDLDRLLFEQAVGAVPRVGWGPSRTGRSFTRQDGAAQQPRSYAGLSLTAQEG